MKKLYFALIGGVILFAWMFISYAMPNLHRSAARYTPQQAEILQKLSEMGLPEGMYLLGQPDPNASGEAQSKEYEQLEGRPWAVINYQQTNSMDMTMPMIRCYLICAVISFLLFWLIGQQKSPTLLNRVLLSLAVGFCAFFFIPYANYIWYHEPDIWAHFADAIVPWVILGLLGHWMAKPKAAVVS